MNTKLGVIQPTTFPDGLDTNNSGVGMKQLPPGYTRLSSQNATIAHAGAAMIAGVPGEFPQNTKMSIQDMFGKKPNSSLKD